jgi:mannose-6-phosphate isomerase-like protein (cupin superfamily)
MIELLAEENVPVYIDGRGKVFHMEQFATRELHIASVEPEAVRGNHVHDRDEIICIMGGNGICEIILYDGTSNRKQTTVIEEDMVAYRIKAETRHTIRNIGKDIFYLVCFYDNG